MEQNNGPSPPQNKADPVRLVQITDCHLGPTADYQLAGVHTLISFEAVLRRVVRDQLPLDYILATGDISAQGSVAAYQHFRESMEYLPAPYAWLPGNHDDLERMRNVLQAVPFQPIVELGPWRAICLNTAVPRQVGGHLASGELALLDGALGSQGDKPVVIFMHHPPVPIGCRWLDHQHVSNGDAMAQVLSRHRNVRAIFTGHVHQRAEQEIAGIPIYCTPSTCFQFAANSDDFALGSRPPGYRWIHLQADGSLETEVVYVEDSGEQVDTGVQGYR